MVSGWSAPRCSVIRSYSSSLSLWQVWTLVTNPPSEFANGVLCIQGPVYGSDNNTCNRCLSAALRRHCHSCHCNEWHSSKFFRANDATFVCYHRLTFSPSHFNTVRFAKIEQKSVILIAATNASSLDKAGDEYAGVGLCERPPTASIIPQAYEVPYVVSRTMIM